MPGIRNYYKGKTTGKHRNNSFTDFNFSPFEAFSQLDPKLDKNPHSPLGTVVVINPQLQGQGPERFLCPNCEERGQLNQLGVVIQEEGGPYIPESDTDTHKQCHVCYNIYPVYGLEHQGAVFVEDQYELITNPLTEGINRPTVATVDYSNKQDPIKKQLDKEYEHRKRNIHPKDKEVLAEIQKGNIVSGYTTS